MRTGRSRSGSRRGGTVSRVVASLSSNLRARETDRTVLSLGQQADRKIDSTRPSSEERSCFLRRSWEQGEFGPLSSGFSLLLPT